MFWSVMKITCQELSQTVEKKCHVTCYMWWKWGKMSIISDIILRNEWGWLKCRPIKHRGWQTNKTLWLTSICHWEHLFYLLDILFTSFHKINWCQIENQTSNSKYMQSFLICYRVNLGKVFCLITSRTLYCFKLQQSVLINSMQLKSLPCRGGR